MAVLLRLLVLAASITSVVLFVTSKETKCSGIRNGPQRIPVEAKFSDSPAFIYFVAALSVAGFYSLITAIAFVFSPKSLLHFALVDVLMMGLVASAAGTADGLAYIGLKGNKHVMWGEVCYCWVHKNT